MVCAPIWIASPPEVHAFLLSNGPGGGPLLAAATMWHTLSAEYAAIAEELSTLLVEVRAQQWSGCASDEYALAYLPYLSWLTQMSVDSDRMATIHEVSAAAYETALATMPTLAELASNHAMHALLVATNFFGINTVLLAMNEADYVRMWIQAATVMETYHGTAQALLATLPQIQPAPPILKGQPGIHPGATHPSALEVFITHLVAYMHHIFADPLKVITHPHLGTGKSSSSSLLTSILLIIIQQTYSISTKMTFWTLVFSLGTSIPIAMGLQLLHQPTPDESEGIVPAVIVPPLHLGLPHPVVGMSQPSVITAGASASVSPTPPAPTPLMVTPVGIPARHSRTTGDPKPAGGVGPTQNDRNKASAPAIRARDQTKRSGAFRKNIRTRTRGHHDEPMTMDADLGEFSTSQIRQSHYGSSTLGFAGTMPRSTHRASGLVTHDEQTLDGYSHHPMLPETWEPDPAPS